MKRNLRAGVGLLGASTLLLAGCAGGVGGAGGGATADSGASVDHGASKEEFIEALADMDPVTLTYQAGSSPTSGNADRDRAFAEAVEEWSGGKITIELLFGQPIAGFGEIADAAADGRIDFGMEIPAYSPAKYPALSELVRLQTGVDSGSYLPEMINVAANSEVAWGTPEILEQYADKGVEALVPVEYEFSHYLMCTDTNSTSEALNGALVSADSPSDVLIVESVGASPTSLPYVEVYEGLQRGVIDCAMAGLKVGMATGTFEVADTIIAPAEGAWGRNATALIAGGKWSTLPLAARQLIFDQLNIFTNGHLEISQNNYTNAMESFSGGYHVLDDEAQANLDEGREAVRADVLDSDIVDGVKLADDLDAAIEKWTAIAEELGYEDLGAWPELAERVKDAPIDYQPFADRVTQEIYQEHRPA